MSKLIKMVCLILGGGQGTRLYPLTEARSKPAVPIGGKYRLIDIPISNCINSGVKRMFVITQFNSASLNQHIKNTYHFDIFNSGFVDILAAEQTPTSKNWFHGTADAVRQSMHHLKNHAYDFVLILSGDQLYQMDLKKMADYHIAKGADLTIATIPVSADDATDFGIMKVNKQGMIERFIEKPATSLLKDWISDVPKIQQKQKKNYLASMGIYIFNKEAIQRLFAENPDATDFGKGIIPASLQSDYKVASYIYDGYWTDIGSIRSFYEANLELADPIPEFNLFDNDNMIYTRPRLLAPSKIFGTKFIRSVLADGCIVNAAKIELSIIGIRSRIGSKTVISRSILMGNDYYQTLDEMAKNKNQIPMGIGNNCRIEQAIVDKNCSIGNNVRVIGSNDLENVDTETYSIVDGIIVIKKGATIPDNTHIGV